MVTGQVPKGYSYELTQPMGENFDNGFKPQLTPKQMLELGVFGGTYFGSVTEEYPKDWFEHAKLSDRGPDKMCNYFEVMASQPLQVWQQKGWIYPDDPLGWFQWYCRYYLGRRIPHEDQRQIKRWKAITRHIAQVKRNCMPVDLNCRPRQRQALLQWAYDSRRI